MRISKYLQSQFSSIVEKYKLIELNIGVEGILELINSIESRASQAEGNADHYRKNFERVAGNLSSIEKSLLEWKKKQCQEAKIPLDRLCTQIHGNHNSHVYSKYSGWETDLTFWEWCELRDYVTYDEVFEDWWQLAESRFMSNIRDGELKYILQSPLDIS